MKIADDAPQPRSFVNITMTMRFLFLSGLAALWIGSRGWGRRSEPADEIYVNANIITMNDGQPRAEALTVKNGKILAVGSRRLVEAIRAIRLRYMTSRATPSDVAAFRHRRPGRLRRYLVRSAVVVRIRLPRAVEISSFQPSVPRHAQLDL
jgi:hypothetical protein